MQATKARLEEIMEAIMTSLLSVALGTSAFGGPVHATPSTVARAAPLVSVQWVAPADPASPNNPTDPSTPAYVAEE
jgi:hypothetical protein